MRTFHPLVFGATLTALSLPVHAEVLVNQQPVPGGGVMRSSQLWQDPGPDGNDLNGDAVCWQDFVITEAKSINHIEWWGNGVYELGFRIEIWKQDPGCLVCYQPYGWWYYGGVDTAEPLVTFDTTDFTVGVGAGVLHYTLDLATPIEVPANSPANPRWYIAIIGLTHVPYQNWNWAKGTGGSPTSFQFIRADGNLFWALPEGRAILIGDTTPACPIDLDGSGSVDGGDLAILLGAWGGAGPADLDHNGSVGGSDLAILLGAWGGC